ncbi:hypothetical protein BCR32DRAFT_242293 [Anaeromyces robustus]|uniref:BAAT/Acyl-CoA thioester hydrolase C-terminal domain-containing protein n=1 Tax=Anaeromyces robustus TaxID=1754192 RepID=A0A1Y1XGM4_9FUNG|nr:hypothetical protein BCR32DRAFT_242293 [Anaeromyces robustus]|eukprot:ORX84842.1 hypothetical protein BCR32DRAFT_242293 [Anaeromyces robustus]
MNMERCTLEKNGFEAVYFPGTISSLKAVISVGGASCDEKMSISMRGSYVRQDIRLPKDLVQIHVDYVEKAVKRLKEEKKIKGIAMTDISTRAAYTLLAASFIPDIGCIIPVVPYNYILAETWLSTTRKTLGYGIRRFMRFGYDKMEKRQLPEARIKVENMHADVLFLAVKNDDAWSSDIAVPRMVKIGN